MESNSFGRSFKISTWGESHGKAIGVVIDGCPAGLEILEEEIQEALNRRAPGKNSFTSPRKEADRIEILSGIFEGRTTGAPISLMIQNKGFDSKPYEGVKDLLKPGHANYTYLEKYGLFDYRGGGRSSGRETACRVAAGAIAKKILLSQGVQVLAYLEQIGSIQAANMDEEEIGSLIQKTYASPLFCPDPFGSLSMEDLIEQMKREGDSIGGVVRFIATGLPVGLGDPVYGKLEACLAYGMMSIPASKGFEIGDGFASALLQGSEHNDLFIEKEAKIVLETNHAGGTLGGISTGMPLEGRVAFKPASSIRKEQKTVTLRGETATFRLGEGSYHDPCIAIRAVPVVEAMLSLVLVDAMLVNRTSRL
jgi:chorismate synthase